jgi:hypothetical protein
VNLRWYAARLRAMSAREYLYRARQTAQKEKRATQAGRSPALRFLTSLPDLPEITQPRTIRFFDLELKYDATTEIDWHCDYSSGKRSPRRFYGHIDYRDSGRIGDAKYIWELNRHQFMAPWALHYALTGDSQDVAAIVHLLLNWIAANPRYVGINWSSALELALRILSWGIVFDLCKDSELLGAVRPMVERSVVEQANYIRSTLSLHSSANNHLVGELVGLLAAGIMFPDAPGTKQHAEFARNEILKQAHLQNFTDGVNREQAIYYHHYTLEYLTTAMALFARCGWKFPDETRDLVRKMVAFVDAMVDNRGTPAEIGDRDDGCVTGLNRGMPFGIYESLLWTGWRLFGEDSFARHAAEIARSRGAEPVLDPRTEYWHGEAEIAAVAAAPATIFSPRPRSSCFGLGGYAVFSVPVRNDALRVLFKSGPFGYPRIAAHSHCDQLSVCAQLNGMELLTDSGTFCYHSDEAWRHYFKGTAAHNTIRVDGQDQAQYGGPFLWATHADGEMQELEKRDSGFRIAGVHYGYHRLKERVDHSRTVEVQQSAPHLFVRDTLGSSAAHRYELIWNFGPDIELVRAVLPQSETVVEIVNTCKHAEWILRAGNRDVARLVISSEHPFDVRMFHGDEHEPAGWYSRKFSERVPIHQLRIEVQAGWWSVDSRMNLIDH